MPVVLLEVLLPESSLLPQPPSKVLSVSRQADAQRRRFRKGDDMDKVPPCGCGDRMDRYLQVP